jgi:hypothetical protein
MFDRGGVHIVLVGSIVYHYCFRFDRRGMFMLLLLYCLPLMLRFDRGVVQVVVVILSTITV